MLPAAHGDCLLVEYGTTNDVHRMLIDGGVARTYNVLRSELERVPEKQRHFELIVVTHVDADHIEGIVKLLSDDNLGLRVREIWFNGLQHLDECAPLHLGGVQGEYLSALIGQRAIPWNSAGENRPIHAASDAALPCFALPGDLQLTILSPTRETMAKMAEAWESEVQKAGLVPGQTKECLEHLQTKGKRLLVRFSDEAEVPDVKSLLAEPYEGDTSPANGSSIAFLAEYEGLSVLFGADAYAEVLVSSIERLLKARNLDVLEVDIFKLPHHGSAANLSSRLMELVRAKRILVSTSGAIFGHPDAEAIARILAATPNVEFVFNYRSEETEIWDHDTLRRQFGYTTRYPRENGEIMRVDVSSESTTTP